MPSAKTLRVYANPWHALDHEGLPAGACACDPDEHTPARKFVGAKIKASELRKANPNAGVPAKHRITFEFSDEAQTIPSTVYYRTAIKRGELIAADVETAKACGFAPDTFKDPLVCLAEEKAAAVAAFVANYGEPPPWAVAPPEPAPSPAPEAAPAPAEPAAAPTEAEPQAAEEPAPNGRKARKAGN